MIHEVMWAFDGQLWKTIIVFKRKNKRFLNNTYIMTGTEVDNMHDCVFVKEVMSQDEIHAAWFTAVREGLVDALKALAARGCNPFITCEQQTARTMVKNWTTRLNRVESGESGRMRLFKTMHDVLYQTEMNWIIHKKLKRTLSKWRKG